MKQRPILFSTAMVQAILAGRKTQTRRVVKEPKGFVGNWLFQNIEYVRSRVKCPYGQPGDILWVREEHYVFGEWEPNGKTKTGKQKWTFKRHIDAEVLYFDKPPAMVMPNSYRKPAWYKRLARFMPKGYCRNWLEITNVKVERLQEILEQDAKAEGVEQDRAGWYKNYLGPDVFGREFKCYYAADSFKELWQSINGPESWKANPWVRVIEFKQINKPQ